MCLNIQYISLNDFSINTIFIQSYTSGVRRWSWATQWQAVIKMTFWMDYLFSFIIKNCESFKLFGKLFLRETKVPLMENTGFFTLKQCMENCRNYWETKQKRSELKQNFEWLIYCNPKKMKINCQLKDSVNITYFNFHIQTYFCCLNFGLLNMS